MINKYCQIQESSTARGPTSTGEPKKNDKWGQSQACLNYAEREFFMQNKREKR